MSRTPGPWEVGRFCEFQYNKTQTYAEITPVGEFAILAWVFAPKTNKLEGEANARFIVNAVNTHDALVDACQALVDEQKYYEEHTQQPGMMPGNQFYSDKFIAVVNLAKAALALAKEDKP